MTETQEQIERRLAEIHCPHNGCTPDNCNTAWLVDTVKSLLPALAVARAAVALKGASDLLVVQFSIDNRDVYRASLAAYDAALARFADAEGGRK